MLSSWGMTFLIITVTGVGFGVEASKTGGLDRSSASASTTTTTTMMTSLMGDGIFDESSSAADLESVKGILGSLKRTAWSQFYFTQPFIQFNKSNQQVFHNQIDRRMSKRWASPPPPLSAKKTLVPFFGQRSSFSSSLASPFLSSSASSSEPTTSSTILSPFNTVTTTSTTKRVRIAKEKKRRETRSTRQFDVPQIDCPAAEDGVERLACPSADRMGRYRCIDDHVLCDGFIDCPNAEDEDRMSCMFFKTTKAHLDMLADAILRWPRGRF